MPAFQVPGATLDYQQNGSKGDPIVLVHGDISDRRTWDALLARFALTNRAYAYSRRGHWPNAPLKPGEGSPVATHVADLEAFLERVVGERAHIVGNSFGGYVALVLAQKRPDLVRSLVLGEPAVVPLALDLPPTPDAIAALAAGDPALAKAMGECLGQCVVPAIERFAAGDVDGGAELFARYHVPHWLATDESGMEMVLDNGAVHSNALLIEHFAPYSEADARRVNAPTLLVTGSLSPAYLPALAERLVKLMPRAEWAQMRGVGHFMHAEAPDEFHVLASAFLARAQ